MPGLDDIAQISISTSSPAVTRAGFGVPLILSGNATFASRTKTYASAGALSADYANFGQGSEAAMMLTPEYLMASAFFAQEPRVERVIVGRISTRPTQTITVTPTAGNLHRYTFSVNGTDTSFTADASSTVAEAVTGIVAAINTVTGGTQAASAGGGTHVLITMAQGAFIRFKNTDPNFLRVEETTVEPGGGGALAADLAAIKLENNDWYAPFIGYKSKAIHTAIAEWLKSEKKLQIAGSSDTGIILDADLGATDVAKTFKTSAYARSGVIYHHDNGAFAECAWSGLCLPLTPGSETWKFKTANGLEATALTDTHYANLKAKYANYYVTIAGINIFSDGKVSANEWIDTVRGRDWLEARLQEDTFTVLASEKKIPFTDAGVTKLEAPIKARLMEAVANGLLSDDPADEPTVNFPAVATVPTADRQARNLPGGTFTARLAGAIHSFVLDGTISV